MPFSHLVWYVKRLEQILIYLLILRAKYNATFHPPKVNISTFKIKCYATFTPQPTPHLHLPTTAQYVSPQTCWKYLMDTLLKRGQSYMRKSIRSPIPSASWRKHIIICTSADEGPLLVQYAKPEESYSALFQTSSLSKI